MNPCSQCSVREAAICQSLSEEELERLNRLGRHQIVERGEAVIWEGDESLLVGNVIEGVLKLTASTIEGRDQTLGILFPSDFIGRPFGKTTTHSVVALTDARICTFARSSFDEFAREHPELEHKLLQHTLTELDRTRHWMMLLGRKSANERVAAFLLEMIARTKPGAAERTAPYSFALPFGRQDIADLLGLTIETVSRQLTQLRDAEIIRTPDRRTVEVLDFEGLERSAGEE